MREKTEYEKMEREFLAPAIVRRARATARKKAWEADLKRTAELSAETEDTIERIEAFKGQPAVIANRLPRGQKELETRLDRLFEYLARKSTNAVAVAFARSRIEQIGRVLDRIDSRRISKREWLSFIIAAGGLLVAVGGVLAAILKK